MKTKLFVIVVAMLVLCSCGKNPMIDDTMLDGDVIFDASTYDPMPS